MKVVDRAPALHGDGTNKSSCIPTSKYLFDLYNRVLFFISGLADVHPHLVAAKLPPLPPPFTSKLMCEALGEVQGRIISDIEEGEGGVLFEAPAAPGAGGQPKPQLARGLVRPTLKANARIRITHLPPMSDLCKPNISSIRGTDLGALIQIQVQIMCGSLGAHRFNQGRPG